MSARGGRSSACTLRVGRPSHRVHRLLIIAGTRRGSPQILGSSSVCRSPSGRFPVTGCQATSPDAVFGVAAGLDVAPRCKLWRKVVMRHSRCDCQGQRLEGGYEIRGAGQQRLLSAPPPQQQNRHLILAMITMPWPRDPDFSLSLRGGGRGPQGGARGRRLAVAPCSWH